MMDVLHILFIHYLLHLIVKKQDPAFRTFVIRTFELSPLDAVVSMVKPDRTPSILYHRNVHIEHLLIAKELARYQVLLACFTHPVFFESSYRPAISRLQIEGCSLDALTSLFRTICHAGIGTVLQIHQIDLAGHGFMSSINKNAVQLVQKMSCHQDVIKTWKPYHVQSLITKTLQKPQASLAQLLDMSDEDFLAHVQRGLDQSIIV